MYSPTRECHDRPGLPSYNYVIKACAEHALPTCLRGSESTKAQGPTCFSCQGLSLGPPRTAAMRKESEKPQKRFIQSHDCFIIP